MRAVCLCECALANRLPARALPAVRMRERKMIIGEKRRDGWNCGTLCECLWHLVHELQQLANDCPPNNIKYLFISIKAAITLSTSTPDVHFCQSAHTIAKHHRFGFYANFKLFGIPAADSICFRMQWTTSPSLERNDNGLSIRAENDFH